MIYELGREGYIEDIDAYNAARGCALSSVKAPPPDEYDREQLKEAYADLSPSYNWDHPGRNVYRRAAFYWSETLYTAAQLREILPPIIPTYNAFNGIDTVERLTAMYPDAFFLPGREHSPVIYVYSADGSTLRSPNEREKAELAVDEVLWDPIQRLTDEVMTYVLRLWWA
jgi:hypothetical protein